jgi:MFS transporter, MHS family, shikimate and dehydroshikimate transport protein
VPFLFSVVLAAVGPWVRYRITESPAFIKAKQAQEAEHYVVKMPLLQVFRRHPRELLIAVGARFADGGNYTAATTTCSPCSSWSTSPNTLARRGAPR